MSDRLLSGASHSNILQTSREDYTDCKSITSISTSTSISFTFREPPYLPATSSIPPANTAGIPSAITSKGTPLSEAAVGALRVFDIVFDPNVVATPSHSGDSGTGVADAGNYDEIAGEWYGFHVGKLQGL